MSDRIPVWFFLVSLTSCPPLRQYGYVPFGVLDVSSTGRQTREGSRTLEVNPLIISKILRLTPSQYAFEDFGICQVAQLLGKNDDEAKYANRSLVRPILLRPSFPLTSPSFTVIFGILRLSVMGLKVREMYL